MSKITQEAENKVWQLHDKMQSDAQVRYIKYIMKEEECSWEEAYAIAIGKTDPIEHEYTLGYKLADPVYMIAMFKQHNKIRRAQAIENFEAQLCAGELEIFRRDVLTAETQKNFKKSYKTAKKEQ